MNRRDMIKATGVGIASTGLLSVLPNCPSAVKIIDSRLSNRINVADLKDNEAGYISNGSILPGRDNTLYFLDRFHMVFDTVTPAWCNEVLICRNHSNFYIKIPQEVFDSISILKPEHFLSPAYLALHQGYPLLLEKCGDFYRVPCEWKDCIKHPLVKKNLKALKEGLDYCEKVRKNQLAEVLNYNSYHSFKEIFCE